VDGFDSFEVWVTVAGEDGVFEGNGVNGLEGGDEDEDEVDGGEGDEGAFPRPFSDEEGFPVHVFI
jgi:hypothetical protein